MHYPLKLSFKVLALAPQLSVTDARGQVIFYVKQKLLKLKESVTVFEDTQQTTPIYHIQADRVLDFSARYHFTDTSGNEVGSVQRQGMRSLWKAHYDVLDGERSVMTIREKNPWVKVIDSLIGEIPILGMLTGFFFHPAFQVSRQEGISVMEIEKQPAFFETRFEVTRHMELSEREEIQALLSLLMMVLLERDRG